MKEDEGINRSTNMHDPQAQAAGWGGPEGGEQGWWRRAKGGKEGHL